MNDNRPIADQAQRLRALDATTSFIVQAPAGSGKTSLLTQRYLTLLAGVQSPEEIVALTFTRKAASEMRNRILDALQAARENRQPDSAHQKQTWDLAARVLQQDRNNDWCLLDAPRRLRILTIDSFVASLNRQMPLLSGFGSTPRIVDNAEPLYRQAARATIAEVESGEQWSPAIECLIEHLDNRLIRLEELIVDMLSRRDHWLRHIASKDNPNTERQELEASLQSVVQAGLCELHDSFPEDQATECMQLFAYANSNLGNSEAAATAGLPDTSPGSLSQWNSILDMLLTSSNESDKINWRQRVDTRNGFPKADKKEPEELQQLHASMKQRHKELVQCLRGVPGLLDVMRQARLLPDPVYSEEQWQVLSSLFELLRIAEAQLRIVFRDSGQVDHTAMSQGALQALGDVENPTELALSLDYRIQHILVDEFQDTSLSQYQLIAHLTAGWQPDDGRTYFLVGDPMQSIYRFREAEVGLYLKAMEEGFGDIRPERLSLSVNFRSQQGIVDWVNHAFPSIMPQQADIANGAIPFKVSTAFHENTGDSVSPVSDAVQIHAFGQNQHENEASRVVSLVAEHRRLDENADIAVLVRNRSHLFYIAELLKQQGMRFQAIEIEKLSHRPVIQDLLSLTFAMCHQADRIAWLSILRAPWCGLTLDDLFHLVSAEPGATIWSLVQAATQAGHLSDDGRQRLQVITEILQQRMMLYRRMSLRTLVEGTWLLLGGPACLENETDLEDVKAFMKLLEQHDVGGTLGDRMQLSRDVDRLFALPDIKGDSRLQLMTIHKAKGLEFDVVLVPGLDRVPRIEQGRLLMWMERPRAQGRSDLLLAPIRAFGAGHDRIYRFLRALEQKKDDYESTRLLYVALTRARKQLHLMCCIPVVNDDASLPLPAKRSLLRSLWPAIEESIGERLQQANDAAGTEVVAPGHTLQRLTKDWRLPEAPQPVPPATGTIVEPSLPEEAIEYSWAGQTARHIGNVVHRILQGYANQATSLTVGDDLIRKLLLQSGVDTDAIPAAVQRIQKILFAIGQDDRGQWILSSEHSEALNEYAISGVHQGQLVHAVLDRTFIDENGVRWIIDYKTGAHGGGDVEDFLDREQTRYQEQLQRYAALMAKKEDRTIRLGLYYPAIPGWREWPYVQE